MCRLLYVKSENQFEIEYHLKKFAEICETSKEYQGHGWGMAYLVDGQWKYYKNINPIWECDFKDFGKTQRLVVHARSAFQDKDIFIENNMPFYDDNYVFVFNGELRGVRINAEGRIGAEKIFNFIKRFDKGNISEAFEKGTGIIKKQTDYIRAMNIILLSKNKTNVYSYFNEDDNYFTMHKKETENSLIICSAPYIDENNWEQLGNNFTGEFK